MRAGLVLVSCVAALTLAACGGGDSREDNAEQFRENVAALDLGTEITLEDGPESGVVNGRFTGPDGKPSRFWFSFGPSPTDDFKRYDKGSPTFVQFYNAGDTYYEAAEEVPIRLSSKQENRYFDIQFAIEDAACQAVTDEDCKGP